MALEKDRKLAGTFNFWVTLRKSAAIESGASGVSAASAESTGKPLGDGGFQECTGLDIEMDVQELQEGGRNDGVIQRVGPGKYSRITLKRGMLYGTDNKVDAVLWGWLQGILTGARPVTRYDGTIQLMGHDQGKVLATWAFDRGIPAKISGPQLNSKSGDIAIEELQIAHEGLRLAID
ncbi:MAG: phage tail protein [Gemmatimonas sp.]|nr:phage tail protein [Gemmatimonas sp.]